MNSDRAQSLHQAGVFAMGVSLDSLSNEEHDRMRGKKGAFKTTLTALNLVADAGLFPFCGRAGKSERDMRSSIYWSCLD